MRGRIGIGIILDLYCNGSFTFTNLVGTSLFRYGGARAARLRSNEKDRALLLDLALPLDLLLDLALPLDLLLELDLPLALLLDLLLYLLRDLLRGLLIDLLLGLRVGVTLLNLVLLGRFLSDDLLLDLGIYICKYF